MTDTFFNFLRPGINTTIQDIGRDNLYHIGIPFSGAMDKRNFLIANKLVDNNLKDACLEFAYQGPLLIYYGRKLYIVITGDVKFQIIKSNQQIIEGDTYKVYLIENNDKIDIQSTTNSVYGYLSINENLNLLSISSRESFSRPPSRFTEASLVKKLEELAQLSNG